MLHRCTAIALLTAAALTAPAAFAQSPVPMAGHCDARSASAAPSSTHEGMHHVTPASPRGPERGATAGPRDAAPCSHCATTPCLTTSHCAGGGAGLATVPSARDTQPSTMTIEPSASRRPGSEAHAPLTPPPDSSPIAS